MNHAEKVKKLADAATEAAINCCDSAAGGSWGAFSKARLELHAAIDEMQVELDRLKGAVAEFTEGLTVEGYAVEDAVRLARLWAEGKLIGGDPHAVSAALLTEIDRLSKELYEQAPKLERLRRMDKAAQDSFNSLLRGDRA